MNFIEVIIIISGESVRICRNEERIILLIIVFETIKKMENSQKAAIKLAS